MKQILYDMCNFFFDANWPSYGHSLFSYWKSVGGHVRVGYMLQARKGVGDHNWKKYFISFFMFWAIRVF